MAFVGFSFSQNRTKNGIPHPAAAEDGFLLTSSVVGVGVPW